MGGQKRNECPHVLDSAQPHLEVSKVTNCKGFKGFVTCSPVQPRGGMQGGPVGLTVRRPPSAYRLCLVKSLMLEGLCDPSNLLFPRRNQ